MRKEAYKALFAVAPTNKDARDALVAIVTNQRGRELLPFWSGLGKASRKALLEKTPELQALNRLERESPWRVTEAKEDE